MYIYIYRYDYNWLHVNMWFYIHIIHTNFSGWDFRVEIISPVLWGASGTIPRSVRAMACHRAELPLQVRRWMDQCDGKHGIFNGVWCLNQWDHIFCSGVLFFLMILIVLKCSSKFHYNSLFFWWRLCWGRAEIQWGRWMDAIELEYTLWLFNIAMENHHF